MKQKGSISFENKKEKALRYLQQLKERENKLKQAVQKTEADIQFIDDEDDQFQVKISA